MSRLQVVLALALTLIIGVPATAHADRWVGDEAVGDAVAWQLDPADFCVATEVESETTSTQDITAMVVRHQPRKLVVRLRYAAGAELEGRSVTLHVRTPRRALEIDASQRRSGDGWRLEIGPALRWHPGSIDTDGDGVDDCDVWSAVGSFWRCPGNEVAVADRSAVVTVPRSCLRDPAWVEVGAETRAGSGDLAFYDEWGTSELAFDPNVRIYGGRVPVSPGQKASPSNRSRVTNSETSWRRSFVMTRTGFPSGTTAATAY